MKKEVVTLLGWMGAGVALCISITLWLLSAHADAPHRDAVSNAVFEQYVEHQREWRDELKADIQEIKRLLDTR